MSTANSSANTSPQAKPNLFEIQSRIFLESMQSLKESKMDDNSALDDDFVFEDEENHQVSSLNILSNSGSASAKLSKGIDLYMNADIEDDCDSVEDHMRQSINSDYIGPADKKHISKKQLGYERLQQSNKLDKIMEKIKFEEKLQAKIDRQYYKTLSQQCSQNIYELFDIPERSESQFLGNNSPKMVSNLQFTFN